MFAPVLALAAVAAAAVTNGTTVTKDVTYFTTYCPEPTTFAVNNVTYTVTSATTLTITDCSHVCEITKVQPSSKASSGKASSTKAPSTATATSSVVAAVSSTAKSSAPVAANGAVAAGFGGAAAVAAAALLL